MSDAGEGVKRGEGQAARSQSNLLPSSMTEKEFGKVYVQHKGKELRVEFTVWVEDEKEGWQTGVALDASASMKDWYGRMLTGKVPEDVFSEYERKNWILHRTEDGRKVSTFRKEALEDAMKQGYVKLTDNIVEPLARDFTAYLAGELDAHGGVTVIYWACGDGSKIEIIGDFKEAACRSVQIRGPAKATFGEGTRLTPAVRYFTERFTNAERGMYIFITDGRLDDLPEVRQYTTQLAREIESNRRNPVKCVLIGVGDKIDESQMEELDDLDTGTEVDIWDHKIAKEMRNLSEIVVELVDENKIVGPRATVYDAAGQVVAKFTDGLPAKAAFVMSASSQYFELEVGGRRIRQSVVLLKP